MEISTFTNTYSENNYNNSNLLSNFDNNSKSTEKSLVQQKSTQLEQRSSTLNQRRGSGGRKNFNDSNKVFIGGINYTTTDDQLREYFTQYGQMLDCVIIKDPQTNKSKGFGFVQYTEPFMVDELMKNRPHNIDNRQLDVHRSIPRNQTRKLDQQRSVNKLFIGGLNDQRLTETDLKSFFEQFGRVLSVYVPKDKETSRPKNFGFVTFDDYDPVDKITMNDSVVINGVKVNVAKASKSPPGNDKIMMSPPIRQNQMRFSSSQQQQQRQFAFNQGDQGFGQSYQNCYSNNQFQQRNSFREQSNFGPMLNKPNQYRTAPYQRQNFSTSR